MNTDLIKYIILIATSLLIMLLTQADFFVVDEIFHLSQITNFVEGNDVHLPNITTFIYLHKIYAWIGQLFNVSDLYSYRWVNVFITLCFASIIYWVVYIRYKSNDWKLAAQLFFLPIVFPYYLLVYTDIPALLLLLTAAQMMSDKRHFWAATLGAAAIFIRQPSLIWLGFIALIAIYQLKIVEGRNWPHTFGKTWPYAAVILLFILYFMINKSVAMGDKSYHQISANLTNVYFMFFVAGLLFLPLVISRSKHAWDTIQNKPWLWLVFLFGLIIYLNTFSVTHTFNSPEYNQFIRNWALNTINHNLLIQTLVYTFSFYCLVSLTSIKLRTTSYNILYLALPLSVLPMPLIEQRYYMVGFTLWQLWRQRTNQTVELIQLIWMMVLSLLIFWGVSYRWFYF